MLAGIHGSRRSPQGFIVSLRRAIRTERQLWQECNPQDSQDPISHTQFHSLGPRIVGIIIPLSMYHWPWKHSMAKGRAGPHPNLRNDDPRFWIRELPEPFETVNRLSRLLPSVKVIEISELFHQPLPLRQPFEVQVKEAMAGVDA